MDLPDLLHQLRRDSRFMRNVTYWHTSPAQPARYYPCRSRLDGQLTEALSRRGIEQLYSHQAQAIEAAADGQNVVVVTPTASGKTLCYNLPVLHVLSQDPLARALYLFPTKALAQDQLAELRALTEHIQARPDVQTYDGDTPPGARPAIRQRARIVISNPDMLHTGILPHHTRWSEFFSHLRFVVLDELHTYRGVFGSHVANVIRRLCRIARFYGSRPQFLCCSATIANPSELASSLLDSETTLVDDDGSPKGERHLVFYDPPVVDPQLGIRRSVILETRDIARYFLQADIQTILFARSRLGTEVLLTYLREAANALGRQREAVRGYRGGYLPNERRAIERGLREGSVRAVVATNALELGIDIGQLSAAILAGYPGTIASTWQQAGRAGRRLNTSAAIFVASASPLDQFIVNHPHYFFGRSPERGLVAPDNLSVLLSHIRCAAFELPFEAGEALDTAGNTSAILEFLAEEGLVRQSAGRWHWMSQTYPAHDVSLRTAGADTFVIQDHSDEEMGPRAIGQLDRFSVPLLAHEGAIYIHEGQTYLVDGLDWEGGVARVRPTQVDYYTDANVTSDIDLAEILAAGEEGRLHKGYGQVTVRSKATAYKKIKLYTHEVLGHGTIDLPELSLPTSAFWWAFPAPLTEHLETLGIWQGAPVLDYGPDWLEQRRRARERDGFRCQSCGMMEEAGRQHDVHHLRPFREFGYHPDAGDRHRTAYALANDLSNLITLCPRCHRLAEAGRQLRSTLAGLAHVVRHVAPLHLMCDSRDLGVVTKSSGVDGEPTLYIYDRMPAGLGFSQALFELEAGLLLRDVEDVVLQCGCTSGCPSCVGPTGDYSGDVKKQVTQLIAAVLRNEVET